MPVKKRITRERTAPGDEAISDLLWGRCFFRGTWRYDDHKENIWQEWKDKILAVWIRYFPGSRPHAWWIFDAPERRRRADGGVHPFDDMKRKRRIAEMKMNNEANAYRLNFGEPCVAVWEKDSGIEYETQGEYLKRLGLLMPGESKDFREDWLDRNEQDRVEREIAHAVGML